MSHAIFEVAFCQLQLVYVYHYNRPTNIKLIIKDKLIYFAKPFFYINESGIPVKKLLDELSIDIYVHKDGRLIYSFYNPTQKRKTPTQ